MTAEHTYKLSNSTAAVHIMQAAERKGIKMCFANPGTSEMHLVEALDHTQMRSVLVLHENVATGAADGYARMTGKSALTLLHLGPGLANGLANLHNAKRAGSPILNLVGEMTGSVKSQDPLLNSDIAAIAGTVSKVVKTIRSPDTAAEDVMSSLEAIEHAGEPGGSRIATLIVPHDVSWSIVANALQDVDRVPPTLCELPSEVTSFLDGCAAAIARPGSKCALLLGRRALLADGGALDAAGRIAAMTGATLIAENAFARVDRGLGRPKLKRLAYFPDAAKRELAAYDTLVVVDTRVPVPMFGYRDGPDTIVSQRDENLWELDLPRFPPGMLLRYLSEQLRGHACRGVFVTEESRPGKHEGSHTAPLTGPSLCAAVARLQPANCIVVDESITSGGAYWDLSAAVAPFSHLTLTGGAIGCGPCVALGAALARPDSTVISLQADGSAMYTFQALWSQAREGARVISIICANSTYQILKVELAKQQIPSAGANCRGLTEIGQPVIDWVALAKGMGVDGVACSTVEEFETAFEYALKQKGPYVIQAKLR